MRFNARCPRSLVAAAAIATLPLAAMLYPAASFAGAFYVPQQDIQGIGRAFAGDAAGIDDPSTIFTNPAGMTLLGVPQISAGISGIRPTFSLHDRGSTSATPGTLGIPVPTLGNNGGDPGSWTPVPNLFAAVPAADGRLWFGLGVSAPFGLSLQYDPTWFGRYDSVESRLLTIDVAPSVAYKINDFLSIGGGIDLQYADATLSNAVPNTLVPGGPSPFTDGFAKVKENGFAVGFNLGVMLQPLPGTRVGLAYRYGITQNLEGNTTISGLTGPLGGLNGNFSSTTALNLPSIVSLGVSQQVTPELTLLAGVQWFDWSRFSELRIQVDNGQPATVLPQGYRNSWTANIGAEYRWSDALTLRAGFQYDQTPTVDAFRSTDLPDGDRYWIAIGATFKLSDNLLIDAAYAHAFFDDGQINHAKTFFGGTPAEGTFVINALANTSADSVSVNIRYKF